MIGKGEFEEIIESFYEHEKYIDKLSEIIPYAFESPIIDWGYKMFDKLIAVYFDSTGVDWINYYLYENPEKCYYQNTQRVQLESIDDLWELIKEYRK